MNILNVLELLSVLHDFKTYSYNGHNSVNIVQGVTVLAGCTSSDHGLYLY